MSKKDKQAKKDSYQLQVETYNGNTWSRIKKRLELSDASIMLCQEHHLPATEIEEKSHEAKKLGWQSLWTAATPKSSKGTTGGAVIMVKEHLTLSRMFNDEAEDVDDKRRMGHEIIMAGRCVAGLVSAPGISALAVYSLYGQCGAGMSHTNVTLFDKIARHIATHDYPWIAGGDYNMEPDQIAAAGIHHAWGGSLIFDPEGHSHVSNTAVSNIDFFIAAKRSRAW